MGFILFISLILIIVLRIQYNFFVEDLIISSLFYSLNPSIDIHLLLKDLPLKISKCKYPNYLIKNQANKEWMSHNLEYCDFLSMSINRKLLYIYEYSSNSYKQHSDSLHSLTHWILTEHFNVTSNKENKEAIEPISLQSIQNKEDIQRFFVENIQN